MAIPPFMDAMIDFNSGFSSFIKFRPLILFIFFLKTLHNKQKLVKQTCTEKTWFSGRSFKPTPFSPLAPPACHLETLTRLGIWRASPVKTWVLEIILPL
jgi:hypothetical protein